MPVGSSGDMLGAGAPAETTGLGRCAPRHRAAARPQRLLVRHQRHVGRRRASSASIRSRSWLASTSAAVAAGRRGAAGWSRGDGGPAARGLAQRPDARAVGSACAMDRGGRHALRAARGGRRQRLVRARARGRTAAAPGQRQHRPGPVPGLHPGPRARDPGRDRQRTHGTHPPHGRHRRHRAREHRRPDRRLRHPVDRRRHHPAGARRRHRGQRARP